MGECLAARLEDPIEHTSFLADVISTVGEMVTYAAIGLAAAAAIYAGWWLVAGAFGAASLTATLGITFCDLAMVTSFVSSLAVSMSEWGEDITSFWNDTANSISPPEISGQIIGECSGNVRIHGKKAARASGKIPSEKILAMIEAENEPPEPEEETDWLETAKQLLMKADSLAGILINPLKQMQVAEAVGKTIAEQLSGMTAGEMFNGAWQWLKNTGMEFLSPTVEKADPDAKATDTDVVRCDKIFLHNTAYIAQGSMKVLINSQPAARTDDLTTCEAKLKPVHEARPVRIGGSTVTVQDIRSGKHPIAAGIELASALFSGKGKTRIVCALIAVGQGILLSKVIQAVLASDNPVHAATGIKVLGDEREEDFNVPGIVPVSWQRWYTSATTQEGMLGQGWCLPCEMAIQTAGEGDNDTVSLLSALGIPVEIGVLPRGTFALVPWMGFRLYRSHQDVFLMETLDGDYFLFESVQGNHYRLTQQADRHQNRLYYRYGSDGRLDFIHDDSHSIQLHLEYRNIGIHTRLARVWEAVSADDTARQDEAFLKVEYGYDSSGMLVTVCDVTGSVRRRFTYNEQGLMTSHRYDEGAVYCYRWQHFPGTEPSPWRVSEHWTELDGRAVDHHRMDWSLAEKRLTVTRENLGQRHWRWDDEWQVTEHTQADGGVWRYEWDDNGNQIKAVDPDGGEYRMSYDRNGNLLRSVDPAGRQEMFAWHPHWSFVTSETDADGNQWLSSYNQYGDQIKVTDPEGYETHYRYDSAGLVTDIVDAKGNVLKQEWNARGQMTEFVDCSGYRTRMRYDRRGRPETYTDAAQRTTAFYHDEPGRLVAVTLPDGRRREYQYTQGGRPESIRQPDGRVTHYRYDARGLLTTVVKPDGHALQAGYDDAGRVLWLENEKGERYAFEHDVMHRMISQTDIGGVRHDWRYSATGQMTEHCIEATRPGRDGRIPRQAYRWCHDAAGRLLSHDNGETLVCHDYGKNAVTLKRFRHEELRLAETERREARPQDSLTLEYDRRGLLTAEENRAGRHEHGYDPLGNLLTTVLPDGRVLENLYYGSGHLLQTQLRDGDHTFTLAEYERDRLHREVHQRQGRMWRQTEYDVSGRISHRRTAQERNSIRGIAAESHYSYDNGDRLVMEMVNWPQEPAWRDASFPAIRQYEWNNADQVISQRRNGEPEERWSYDACGNLVDVTRPHPVVANRVEEYNGIRCEYDAFGRLSRKSGHRTEQRFEYDADFRLVRVENVQGGEYSHVEMEYDLLGRRTLKRAHHRWRQEAEEETRFAWTGLRLYGEQRMKGPEILYTYEEGSYAPHTRITGRKEDARIQWYHNAQNGRPEALADENGTLVWRERPELWGGVRGERLDDGAGIQQNLRFQGQYLDRETGLHYNLFRYYDPECGRFTQPDPIGLAGGINLYQYAPNPLSWIDPLGLSGEPIGSENNPFGSSRAARREAMRQAGIPTSQQPISQSQNSSGREYSYETPKPGGGTGLSSVQEQTMDISHPDKPHWEAGQVKTDDFGNPRMNKYGRPQLRNGKGKAYYGKGGCK